MNRHHACAHGLLGRLIIVAGLLGMGAHSAVAETVRGDTHAVFDSRDPGTWSRVVMPRATALALNKVMVPGFSRQTGLACSACHFQFPQLTPFGRQFKLNGYTMTALTTIRAHAADTTKRETLGLLPIPPISAMAVASLTTTRTAIPGTQNNTASFPQQASIFLAGAVATHVGIFSQFTYAAADGTLGIDNVDIRYANHTTVGEQDLLYGVTLNNNPTVQDVWNTVPAWGFPFMSSGSAPSGNAATLIEGGFGQQVVGLGAYGLWNSLLYTEFTAYRSAPQGAAGPLDSTAANTVHGVMPYWRVALQHQFDAGYLMVGTFGIAGSVYPSGVTGLTNRHTDLGFDAQFERPAGDGGAVILRSSFIRESRTLSALVAETPAAAANVSNRLNTLRVNATYQPNTIYGFTAGLFGAGGTTDTLLYAPGAITGSALGSPSTRGYLAELSVNPWQNVRIAGQYIGYTRFNGASQDYDGSGRNASGNGTFYLYTWIAY
ncbi:hypothetical protein BH11GEM2_BH11GEM2_05630 [soil metagenome]